jgi:KDO2-lipid IV(A) lauroyltransferase
MARRRNPVVVWATTTATILFGRLTSALPLPVARMLGRYAGRIAYFLVPRVRNVSRQNLDFAYGDTLTSAEKRRIARRAAENAGIVAAEFSRIPELNSDTVSSYVTFAGMENLRKDGGTFLIGAHMGNWEWMAPSVAAFGCRVVEIVRPLDDPRLNRYVDATRTAQGVRTIDKDGSGGEIMRSLKNGWMVGVLVDQSPREAAVPVTFFGQPCWATVAPAMVATRAKVPIHVMTMVRAESGRYTLTLSPPIELTRTGNLRQDLVGITQRCQDYIEAEIRKCPEQWLWLHRRWKERPRLEADWQAREARDAAR